MATVITQHSPYYSEDFLVSIKGRDVSYKILRLQFYKKSIIIESPWFMNKEGLVSIGRCLAGPPEKATLTLEEEGKVTSHLVKYNHPIDGNVHFSQDGKVYSLKKNGLPFENVKGHMFSVYLHNLNGFEKTESSIKAKYKHIPFSFDSSGKAYKITGHLYKKTFLSKLARDGRCIIGPFGYTSNPREKKKPAYYLSAPISYPTDSYTLVLTCQSIKPISQKENESSLLFIGGFDSDKVMNNFDIDTKMLVMSYPVDNLQELKQRLGCIDYIRRIDNAF